MATKPLMLEGIDEPSADEGPLRQWRKEKQRLEDRVADLERQLDHEKRDAARLLNAVNTLRQYLNPQYRALRILYGEIEAVAGQESSSPTSAASPSGQTAADPRWESFKQTFPGMAARIIDALLAHQQMTMGQLSVLLKAHYDTIKTAIAKLTKAGAVVKDGTMCRLNR